MTTPSVNEKTESILVGAFKNATLEVLSTMAWTEATLNDTLSSQNSLIDPSPEGVISAVIDIKGEHENGVATISFPNSLCYQLVSRLMGVDEDSISPEDTHDGICELANMISGNAKVILSHNSESPYSLSLPTAGSTAEIIGRLKACGEPWTVMIFEADGRQFNIQVAFQ